MIGNLEFLNDALLNEKNSPLTNLKNFFENFIDVQEQVLHCSKGCLMGNMTMELADVNETFQEKAKLGFENSTAIFETCLHNAKLQNEIKEDADVPLLANFIINSWQGAALRMKADKTTDALWKFYHVVFDQLLN